MSGLSNLFSWDIVWSKSYYQILQIDENSPIKDIKKAYRKLAVTLHPDKLQLNTPEEKSKAEQNFVKLAKAYEVLSDEKVKRKRYDYLLKYEGIFEYPDDLSYNWEWIDQKIGLSTQKSYRQYQERDRNSWTYEEAQRFFKEASKDDEWSWEKDTTLRDIQEHPLIFFFIIVTIGIAVYFPSIFKYLNQQLKSKPSRENILQKVKNVETESQRQQKNQQNQNIPKSFGRNIRLKRKELVELLNNYLEELIVYCSKCNVNNTNTTTDNIHSEEVKSSQTIPSVNEIRKELEENPIESFSEEEIEHFCFQLKDQGIIDSYIELFQLSFVQFDDQIIITEDEKNIKFELDISESLELLENLTTVTEDYRNRKRLKGNIKKNTINKENEEENEIENNSLITSQEENDENNNKNITTQVETIIFNRQWTIKELTLLSKGIQKYPGGTRQRWEMITNYLNHQLKPIDLYTKEECLQQYQNLRKKPMKNTSIESISLSIQSSSTSSTDQWSLIQQQQLEEGLKKYPISCGLSISDRWKVISDMVENKTIIECIKRYKEINKLIKSKKEIRL